MKKEVVFVKQPEIKVEEKEEIIDNEMTTSNKENESTEGKVKRSFFDKYIEKIKEFLDNAE